MKKLRPVITYYKLHGSDCWHWYQQCPIFRRTGRPFETRKQSGRPSTGELCDACKAIERRAAKGAKR